MNKSKTIIITRRTEYGENASPREDYKCVSAKAYKSKNILDICLKCMIANQIKNGDRANAIAAFNKYFESSKFFEKLSHATFDLGEQDWLSEYTNKSSEALNNIDFYSVFEKKEIGVSSEEIILVYWDKIPCSEYLDIIKRNRCDLVYAIIKDFKVEKNGKSSLFIHDKEWAINEEAVLIHEKEKICNNEEYISDDEVSKLSFYFNYVTTFRHVGKTVNFDAIKKFTFKQSKNLLVYKDVDNVCEQENFFNALQYLKTHEIKN